MKSLAKLSGNTTAEVNHRVGRGLPPGHPIDLADTRATTRSALVVSFEMPPHGTVLAQAKMLYGLMQTLTGMQAVRVSSLPGSPDWDALPGPVGLLLMSASMAAPALERLATQAPAAAARHRSPFVGWMSGGPALGKFA